MKSLSQSEYGELRNLYERVYAPKFESILDEFTDEDLDDLTDEYIEEQVTEFFQECLEEGLDIAIVEQTICESIDSSLDLLTERVDPKETRRRIDQAKDRLETSRAMRSAAAKSKSSSASERDAGAEARARLTSDSSDKRANRLSKIKGVVKKVATGAAEVAGKAVGHAKNLAKDVGSAAKSGYQSTQTSRTSSAGTSTSSAETSSADSSSSSGGGSSSSSRASRRRTDGLLKRGLKKLVRGAAKAVSLGAGAIKAGADYVKSRSEEMNHTNNKTIQEIQELYNSIYESHDVHEENIDEATAMAKRGYDETKLRKRAGGGEAADRATALEKRPTYGDKNKEAQRSRYARAQRGDFRNTASSSPGLHGYGHQSNDPKVKAKQAARGAQRGALTPNEKKQLNMEMEYDVFDMVIEFLQVEGYAETLEEAEWMMANMIDEEAIGIILEAMDEDEEELDEALSGERYKKVMKKPGGTAYSRKVSADPSKRATRGGRGGESDFGAGDRGAGNKAARRAGTYQEEQVYSQIDEVLDTPEKANEYARKNVRSMLGAFAKGVANKDISQLKTINKRTEGAKRAKRKAERKAAEEQKEAFDAWLDEAMTNYEKNRKRAAQRAAARNAARDQGKTGAVPGVGYVTPRRESEYWTDESGKKRHAKGL